MTGDFSQREDSSMKYDKNKVDEMTLALLKLTSFSDDTETRTWKNYQWDSMDRLHEKGYISNPKGKNRSVAFTEKGRKRSEELFRRHFE